ncbi:3934_t:CDS:2, partial [Acaulospora colombiana]
AQTVDFGLIREYNARPVVDGPVLMAKGKCQPSLPMDAREEWTLHLDNGPKACPLEDISNEEVTAKVAGSLVRKFARAALGARRGCKPDGFTKTRYSRRGDMHFSGNLAIALAILELDEDGVTRLRRKGLHDGNGIISSQTRL